LNGAVGPGSGTHDVGFIDAAVVLRRMRSHGCAIRLVTYADAGGARRFAVDYLSDQTNRIIEHIREYNEAHTRYEQLIAGFGRSTPARMVRPSHPRHLLGDAAAP
jgi:hypothetical protein